MDQVREAPEGERGDVPHGACGQPKDVHVVVGVEPNYLRGALAVMNSILKNAECPGAVLFHVVVTAPDGGKMLANTLHEKLPHLRFHKYPFDDKHVRTLITRAMREDLSSSLNYARFYLHALLPECVSKIVYFDTDLIVTGRIEKLWAMPLHVCPPYLPPN